MTFQKKLADVCEKANPLLKKICWYTVGEIIFILYRFIPTGTLVPEMFLEIFLRVIENETREEMKTSCEAASKRKTSGYLALESHFHGNYRVRVCRPSDAEWLIILQTRKSIWLVRIIWTNEGTMRISLAVVRSQVNFACTREIIYFSKILHVLLLRVVESCCPEFEAGQTFCCPTILAVVASVCK